jgi:hypothetical protein
MPGIWLRVALAFCSGASLSGVTTAQVQPSRSDGLTADFALRYQFYRFSTSGGFGTGRYPTHLPRFDANGEYRLSDKFSIPFALRIGRTLPSPLIINPPTKQSLTQYLLHPGTMVYLGPKWRHLQLHLGSQTPYFSELSIGDLQLFGLGATYEAGSYRFFGVAGIGQRHIEPTGILTGAFRRDVLAFRVERKLQDKHVVGLNLVHAKDRLQSVDTVFPLLLPQKGIIISANGNFKLNSNLTVNGEVANAAFASDTRVDSLDSEFSPAGLLVASSHTSSFAVSAGMRYAKRGHGLNAHIKRIGREFNHLAYPQRDNDVLDVRFTPYGQLLGNRLSVSGQFGFLSNSVSQLDSSLFGNQLYGTLNTNLRPLRVMDLQVNYFRSHVNADNPVDSLKYKALVQNFQVAPTFKKKLFGINQRLTLLLSWNSTATNESPLPFLPTSIMSNRQISYSTDIRKISLTASYSILTRKAGLAPTPTTGPRTNTLALTMRARLKANKLHPFISLNLAGTKLTTTTPPSVLGRKNYVRAGCQYRFSNKTSGQIEIANNHFKYGSLATSPTMNEFFVQLELKHSL